MIHTSHKLCLPVDGLPKTGAVKVFCLDGLPEWTPDDLTPNPEDLNTYSEDLHSRHEDGKPCSSTKDDPKNGGFGTSGTRGVGSHVESVDRTYREPVENFAAHLCYAIRLDGR